MLPKFAILKNFAFAVSGIKKQIFTPLFRQNGIFLFSGMSDYDRIRRACLKRGELWEDPDFPATQASVFYHQTPPFQFTWKRPKVGD